ncbi:MAG: OmpA family protein [Acidobacteria bacterium]|nr:OmpA family protein [Acidobacteriota bacterium]
MKLISESRGIRCAIATVFVAALIAANVYTGSAQDAGENRPTRTIAAGQKAKIKGTIISRDADTITLRDGSGMDVIVEITDRTTVASKGGFLRRGTNYDVTSLLRGLTIEAEGRGNASGQLTAEKIRFSKDDLETARSIDSRVSPVEGRVTKVEAQNEALAGQVDELNEVSKNMRTDIDTNREEIARTNERISSLDDYLVQDLATVYFKLNSAVLSPEGMAELDVLAQKALATRGYMVEVTGFADSTGNQQKNRVLSQKRADAVVRYLAETYDIPLRRMITPFGYGDLKPVADNDTIEGRSQNRRVEVKILVNRGLTQAAPATTASSTNP